MGAAVPEVVLRVPANPEAPAAEEPHAVPPVNGQGDAPPTAEEAAAGAVEQFLGGLREAFRQLGWLPEPPAPDDGPAKPGPPAPAPGKESPVPPAGPTAPPDRPPGEADAEWDAVLSGVPLPPADDDAPEPAEDPAPLWSEWEPPAWLDAVAAAALFRWLLPPEPDAEPRLRVTTVRARARA